MADVEIFTPVGVLAGTTSQVPLTNDGPNLASPLPVLDARWYPLDGSRASHRGTETVQPDDILLIVTPELDLRIHMAWYSVALEVGPYRVSGRLATLPGFDPARAIARPSGSFVALSDVTIEVVRQNVASSAARPHVHVNRYAVDRVTSSLMLGHFFPGARLVAQEAGAVVA
ncbi:MAG TPA: hypothetical protein VGM49_00395 [Candidatus Limnocylindrales bacterium]